MPRRIQRDLIQESLVICRRLVVGEGVSGALEAGEPEALTEMTAGAILHQRRLHLVPKKRCARGDGTVALAAVAIHGVAVVAGFAARLIEHPIAAEMSLARHPEAVSTAHLARARPVCADHIGRRALIALFREVDLAIATEIRVARRLGTVSGADRALDDPILAAFGFAIAVITGFHRISDPVSA